MRDRHADNDQSSVPIAGGMVAEVDVKRGARSPVEVPEETSVPLLHAFDRIAHKQGLHQQTQHAHLQGNELLVHCVIKTLLTCYRCFVGIFHAKKACNLSSDCASRLMSAQAGNLMQEDLQLLCF